MIGLVAAIVGAGLIVWAFLAGIDAALNGAGEGAAIWTVLFFVGAILVVAAMVLSLYRLVTGGSKILAWSTIMVAIIPMTATLFLLATSRG